MITDLFVTRYPNRLWFGSEVPPKFQQLFTQSMQIFFEDLGPALKLDQDFCNEAHEIMCRELGVYELNQEVKWSQKIGRYLGEAYDLWRNSHGDADTFIRTRLSMIELLFRMVEERVRTQPPAVTSRWRRPTSTPVTGQETVRRAIEELNGRLRHSGVGLRYHSGMLHPEQDQLTEQAIITPCWEILKDPQWANADRELKEACDRAARGEADAAFHAGKALESVLKIISDMKGWTTGNERGAASFIDNLVSQRNGRFIDVWESELLKAYFMHVRNPHGHGAGSGAPPSHRPEQKTWAIENAMTWIKSLVSRL